MRHGFDAADRPEVSSGDGLIDKAALSWLVDDCVNRKLFVECKPVDVTTPRATPRVPLKAIPSSTFVRVSGGAFRNSFSWRRLLRQTTPNRWLSVSRLVGPRSKYRRFRSFQAGDLPPPRAQENMAEKAQPELVRLRLRWDRSTDADGEGECARASPPNSLHRPLDKRCFIDGGWTAPPAPAEGDSRPPLEKGGTKTARLWRERRRRSNFPTPHMRLPDRIDVIELRRAD